MRAQVSVEYIIIIGIILVITIPLFYYAINETNKTIKINQANDAVLTIANAADTVYSLGSGSKKYVWVNIPGGVASTSVKDNEILLKLHIFGGTSDVYAKTKGPVTGSFPSAKGRYKIKVEMLETSVRIE